MLNDFCAPRLALACWFDVDRGLFLSGGNPGTILKDVTKIFSIRPKFGGSFDLLIEREKIEFRRC